MERKRKIFREKEKRTIKERVCQEFTISINYTVRTIIPLQKYGSLRVEVNEGGNNEHSKKDEERRKKQGHRHKSRALIKLKTIKNSQKL